MNTLSKEDFDALREVIIMDICPKLISEIPQDIAEIMEVSSPNEYLGALVAEATGIAVIKATEIMLFSLSQLIVKNPPLSDPPTLTRIK